jgi:hypothetical protein
MSQSDPGVGCFYLAFLIPIFMILVGTAMLIWGHLINGGCW